MIIVPNFGAIFPYIQNKYKFFKHYGDNTQRTYYYHYYIGKNISNKYITI